MKSIPVHARRRVFPIGLSLDERDGLQFLRYTWCRGAHEMTQEVRLLKHFNDPQCVAHTLEVLARSILARAENNASLNASASRPNGALSKGWPKKQKSGVNKQISNEHR